MKKMFFTIVVILLSALLLITACAPPDGGLPKGTKPSEITAGNAVTPSETTDADSSTIITTTETFETVDPDLLYEIRNSPFASEAWLKSSLPNIIDISVEHRISEKKFEPFLHKSDDDYKTLSEWIELIGKPHGFTNRTANLDFVWITQEGTFILGYISPMTSSVPEGVSLEERLLHLCKIYIYLPRPAPESNNSSVTTATPETTEKVPETTCEPIPGTTEEYVETTVDVGDWPWP